ncbi:MAG: dipeptide ABC transporter ATP-binding protein [Spirochaetales bacterium]|nr:dipeptide ABC transporter ATP-binding protein [Spirochaetales bacterium]
MSEKEKTLELVDLKKYYPIKKGVLQKVVGHVKAVDGVSFHINKGETFGLVGESGCGKSTIGKTIIRLTPPTAGQALYKGTDIFSLDKKSLRTLRPHVQMIFQDPYSSLNPKMPVGEIIGEAVREHGIVSDKDYREYVMNIMKICGLRPYHIDRYPHEFSGGQRQRICIARSIALNPDLVIADEPVSALDVSIQAQIINLMKDIQQRNGISYLFISHDLSVVEYISDVVGVMYLGSLVELAPKKELFKHPAHPYTQALLSAVPVPDPDVKMNRVLLQGDIPSPVNPPSGCKFHTRCPYAKPICSEVTPEFKEHAPGHKCACHLYNDGSWV